MFSVTIWRNDTPAENKGKIEFQVENEKVAPLNRLLLSNPLLPLFHWCDVNGVMGFLASNLIAKVEIKEVK